MSLHSRPQRRTRVGCGDFVQFLRPTEHGCLLTGAVTSCRPNENWELGWPTETAAPKSKTSLDQLDAEFDADADFAIKKDPIPSTHEKELYGI